MDCVGRDDRFSMGGGLKSDWQGEFGGILGTGKRMGGVLIDWGGLGIWKRVRGIARVFQMGG